MQVFAFNRAIRDGFRSASWSARPFDAPAGLPPALSRTSMVSRLIGRAETPRMVREEVTVLFTDIEGFTRIAEGQSLERTAALLSAYYADVTAAATATGGTIDKFIGDGVLAFWSRRTSGERHAERALSAVANLRRRLGEKAASGAWGEGGLEIRFGLHSGEALVGAVGRSRLTETLVGDVVNVASRLQEAAKALGTRERDAGLRGFASRETLAALGGGAEHGTFEELLLPGRTKPVRVRRL